MLRMLGYGDNIGSGFPAIVDACKKENWQKPLLCESNELHTVELTISMKSVIAEECIQHLRKILGEQVVRQLDSEEIFILSVAWMDGSVTNSVIQTLLDKNALQVGKLLYSLAERKLLTAQNKGRWTSYVLNRNLEENSRSKSQGVSTENSRSKTQGVDTKKSRSKSRKEKQRLILDFCQTPRTLLEIAQELNVNDRYYMKRTYIDPLLSQGRLSAQQESKTAPTQKYITIKAVNK